MMILREALDDACSQYGLSRKAMGVADVFRRSVIKSTAANALVKALECGRRWQTANPGEPDLALPAIRRLYNALTKWRIPALIPEPRAAFLAVTLSAELRRRGLVKGKADAVRDMLYELLRKESATWPVAAGQIRKRFVEEHPNALNGASMSLTRALRDYMSGPSPSLEDLASFFYNRLDEDGGHSVAIGDDIGHR